MPEFDLPRADILDVIGKGLTEADLIDAHRLGPNARLRRIEREPLLETTWHVLAEAAAEIPDQVAWNFFEQDAAMTYQEALAAVNRLAGGLQAIGIGSGSHVAIMLPNVPAFPIAWLAISRLGAVMVPVNARYTAEELAYVLNDSDSEFLIIDGQFLEILAKVEIKPAALSDTNIIVHDAEYSIHLRHDRFPQRLHAASVLLDGDGQGCGGAGWHCDQDRARPSAILLHGPAMDDADGLLSTRHGVHSKWA